MLSGVTPLKGLSDEDLRMLARVMRTISVPAGTEVVREGEVADALYVVVVGSVRVMHHGVVLAKLRRGDHFGEVAVVVGGKRTATVVADEACVLLCLDAATFTTLTETNTPLALALLRQIVADTSAHLARMNDAVGQLLSERALSRRVDLEVRLGDERLVVRSGTAADALLPAQIDGVPVVAALVDGRARPLGSPLVGSCTIAPLTTRHWEGQRIFRQSLGLVALEAAHRAGMSLTLGPSLGFARRIDLATPAQDIGETARLLQAAMLALVKQDDPLVRQQQSVLEALDYFERQGAEATVRLLETTHRREVALVSYGHVFALDSGPLLPRTGQLTGFAVVADGANLLLVYGTLGRPSGVARPVSATDQGVAERAGAEHAGAGRPDDTPCQPATTLARQVSQQYARMTESQHLWLRTMQISSVGHFNHACITAAVEPLIHVAEGYHERHIGRIADAIAARRGTTRLISIAGPSSSGKTTFIRRLTVQLRVIGLRPVGLGIDDYYVDRQHAPRTASGELDFEALEALHLGLLQDHLARLVAGDTVRTARFDFVTGTSFPTGGRELQLQPSDLLLIEGIHGLNPRLVDAVPPEQVFRIFVCPLIQLPVDRLTQVHTSDLRLLRRIVRDRHGRSLNAAETIQRWPAVRQGERQHIFPYQHHADEVFDTSLVYELSVLKVFADRYLLEVPSADPAQATAERLLDLLDSWVTIYPDHVPPTSLLREFIGGSGFSY